MYFFENKAAKLRKITNNFTGLKTSPEGRRRQSYENKCKIVTFTVLQVLIYQLMQ